MYQLVVTNLQWLTTIAMPKHVAPGKTRNFHRHDASCTDSCAVDEIDAADVCSFDAVLQSVALFRPKAESHDDSFL